MYRTKGKKIYYVPGIISLAILPAAFYFFAVREIRESTLWAIPFFLPDTAFIKDQDVAFSKFNRHFPPKRNYTDIAFTGKQQDDDTKLAFAQIRIGELLNAGDTLNGLHFIFDDNSTYGTFVSTIDKLRLEGAKTYMPLDNDLWFYYFRPDTTAKAFEYDCFLCNDVIYVKCEVSWLAKIEGSIVQIWQTSWQIIVLYSGFLLSLILIRRQRNESPKRSGIY